MLAYFERTLSWQELLKRTYKELMEDDALGLAAQLAYYFFLALFPAILCVIALASFLPLQNFTDEIVSSLGRFAPDAMLSILREQMVRLSNGNDGGVFTVVDHKSFPGAMALDDERLNAFGGQVDLYTRALRQGAARDCYEYWIHQPIAGLMIKVELVADEAV